MLSGTRKITALLVLASAYMMLGSGAAQAKDCGGLNQSSCWNVNPAKWCNGDLQYKPTGVPGKGTCVKRKEKPSKPKKTCGGLGQSSCWNVNPAKWCEGDLRYKPTGVPGKGTCVTREKETCGNLGQSSCWNVNPARWCNGNLKYKPTGVPGQGTCVLRVSDNDLKDVAATVVDRLKQIGDNNPLANLRTCLKRPQNQAQLFEALNEKSKNGVNAVLKSCNASPDQLAKFAHDVLGTFGGDGSAKSATRSLASTTRSNTSSDRGDAVNLSISGGGNAGAGVGVEGGLGYRIELRSNPEGRFYVSGGISTGFGISAGADLSVGLNYGSMPTTHWAREPGVSVSYSGKAVYGGGVAVDFETDSIVPSGFTLSGGVGAGGEAGVVTGSVTQYLYNF